MSLFRPVAALFLTLFLAGCGFQPMYGAPDASGVAGALGVSRSQIDIANIPNRDGQYLRNQLIDRLYMNGRPADAPYLLTVTPLKDTTTDLGIRRDATATRAMFEIDAVMTLTDKKTGKVLLTRAVRSVGGYNELDNQLATLVSEQNLTDNMLQELSDTIVRQLDLYFARTPVSQAAPVPASKSSP